MAMIDYLDWESELTLEEVFASVESHSFPHIINSSGNHHEFLYLTTLKSEQSRAALMLCVGAKTQCITPQPFSLRTSVNEYGGKPFWLFGDELLFVNQKDQCLYRQWLSEDGASSAERVTNPAARMYTDLIKLKQDTYLAIVEQECAQDQENTMCIAILDLSRQADQLIMLGQGADFYSNLVYHPASKKVAWVQWDHPNMPWDETQLWVADLRLPDDRKRVKASLVQSTRVSLDAGACVCQLLFAANGRLFFSADYPSREAEHGEAERNFWNVHSLNLDGNSVSRVSNIELEFGYPHWVYGDARIVQLCDDKLLVVGSSPEGDAFFAIDQESLHIAKLHSSRATIQHLHSDGRGSVMFEYMSQKEAPAIKTASLKNDESLSDFRSVLTSTASLYEMSQAEHIRYQGKDDGHAYGFFYAPVNGACQAQTSGKRKPPLIVLVHGGPTARAYAHFDIQKQFWTSRGFALFDVNHRGSSGYGRRYRDALYGHWGDLDISDIIDGIDALVNAGKIDPERVCIRGKSAGGYAVLRALTEHPNYFKVGACYYGIGNLVTLAETTHKFEKHYTDRLIGEAFAADTARLASSRFHQRSPIHKMNRVTSAMIVFQGLLDKVVPPGVAREVIDVLTNAEIEHDYIEYVDEGHGFRIVDNNIDAWTKELAFYRKVLTPIANASNR